MSAELDKIRARLGSIPQAWIANYSKSVRTLLEQDMPALIRVAQVAVDMGWTNLLSEHEAIAIEIVKRAEL